MITLFSFHSGSAQNQEKNCAQGSVVVSSFKKDHVNPRELNDTFSLQLFEHVIESVDKSATFFTEKDIAELSKHKYDLDDQLNRKSCEFLTDLTILYSKKIKVAEGLVTDILSKPFNFEKDEEITLSYDTRTFTFAKDEVKLKEWWRKKLKLQVLQMARKADTKEEFMAREPQMRLKVEQRAKRKLESIAEHPNGFENYVSDIYLNSIANLHDPHSTYFSVNEKDEFESHLSKEVLSFGLEVSENRKGRLEVVRLVPGGPAWKSNQLHKGDLLDKIIFDDGEVEELNGLSVEEATELLKQDRANKITLEFTNSAGISKSVSLKKEKVRADENIIKSFILNGVENVGFISLPGFYTEWGADGNLGCAEDMAREITKLQLENVQGLILDLRFNGGGSLAEAIDLAGIFIDEGVLFMVTDPEGKAVNIKDRNRGTIFDGPLIIMINEASASASEILSASLQDHNRALIVGSKSYGKATGQNILPVDSLDKLSSLVGREPKASGYAKITTTRLYRVTGKSYQKKGIEPDVKLPSLFKGLIPTEAEELYALDSEPVAKAKYFKPMEPLPIEKLAAGSKVRVDKDELFNKTISLNDSLRKEYSKSDVHISLKLVDRLEENKKPDVSDEVDEIKITNNILYKVENHKYDQSVLNMDTYGKELNKSLVEQLEEDIQIAETYKIMLDFIKLDAQ